MTQEDIIRYLRLAARKSYILSHSGVDWKPEYGPELEQLDQEIAPLREAIEQEHKCREKKEK